MIVRRDRDELEWDRLVEITTELLKVAARRNAPITYAYVNQVLESRGVRPFDFSLPNERAAVGQALGEIVLSTLDELGGMLSAFIIQKSGNDPGEGFYRLAAELDPPLLGLKASPDMRWKFWAQQMAIVHKALA